MKLFTPAFHLSDAIGSTSPNPVRESVAVPEIVLPRGPVSVADTEASLPADAEHAESRLPPEDRRLEDVGRAEGGEVSAALETSNDLSIQRESFARIGSHGGVNVKALKRQTRYPRHCGETAEDTRKPEADAPLVGYRYA